MLRALVAALLIANLAFWAWSAGALDAIGLGPAQERDPARLALQVQPEAVRVVPTAAASALAVSASASAGAASGKAIGVAQCLEAGPFAAATIEAAERALAPAALPEGSWLRSQHEVAAQYAVVLGPFASRDSMRQKAEEIARLRLATEALELPGEANAGKSQTVLALGRYDGRGAADAALAAVSQRGVRTARIAVLKPAISENRLRVPNPTAAQAEQLRALSDPALGSGFVPCSAGANVASR